MLWTRNQVIWNYLRYKVKVLLIFWLWYVKILFVESYCLGMQYKARGILLVILNMDQWPIANKYCEGKMKSTSKGELEEPEIIAREWHKVEFCWKGIVWGRRNGAIRFFVPHNSLIRMNFIARGKREGDEVNCRNFSMICIFFLDPFGKIEEMKWKHLVYMCEWRSRVYWSDFLDSLVFSVSNGMERIMNVEGVKISIFLFLQQV